MAKQNTLHAIHVQRNDTAANWNAANPVLLKGEMGVEIDTRKFKFGDGANHWADLEYADKTLSDALAAETARAKKAESDLGQRITDEQSRAETAEEGLDQKITEEKTRAETAESGLSDRITAATTDISKIRELIKGGATLDEAKTALAALGDNYKDLYAVASTLKTFLLDSDAADASINRWQEIEAFLKDITDTETLTGLLNALETKLTAAYTAAVAAETTRASAVEQGLDTRLSAAEKSITDSAASFDSDVNKIIDGRFADDVYILLGGDANGHGVSD